MFIFTFIGTFHFQLPFRDSLVCRLTGTAWFQYMRSMIDTLPVSSYKRILKVSKHSNALHTNSNARHLIHFTSGKIIYYNKQGKLLVIDTEDTSNRPLARFLYTILIRFVRGTCSYPLQLQPHFSNCPL